jgi:protein-S-isoprenylcysteine O-methyltransferase Ste14
MTGILRLTASIAVILVAGLAVLLVFDVIPPEVFSNAVKKIVLTGAVAILTAVALIFIMRSGK